jgi:ribosomal protein L11 methyltransferase
VQRIRFELPAEELEDVLDRVIPLLPAGLREAPAGPDRVELTAVAAGGRLPDRAALEAAAGRALEGFTLDEVPADWRLRRARADVLIAGRVVLRAPEDPEPDPGVLDVVIAHSTTAFGTGTHPTTRMCVELLLELDPAGAFVDVGCGVGTLAIVAAKLGFAPVAGVDRSPEAIEQAVANAAANGVEIDFELADVEQGVVASAPTLAVNAPPAVHARVVAALDEDARAVVVSGLAGPELDPVLAGYADVGFTPVARRDADHVWSAVVVRRG